MAAVELNLNPTDRILRQFGWIGCVALPILGWLYAGRPTPTTWQPTDWRTLGPFLLVAGWMGLLAALKPSFLKWPFVIASVITFPIGFVLGEVTMLAMYLLVFAPVAIFFRLIQRDALQRTIDRDADSYWEEKPPAKSAASYFRQS